MRFTRNVFATKILLSWKFSLFVTLKVKDLTLTDDQIYFSNLIYSEIWETRFVFVCFLFCKGSHLKAKAATLRLSQNKMIWGGKFPKSSLLELAAKYVQPNCSSYKSFGPGFKDACFCFCLRCTWKLNGSRVLFFKLIVQTKNVNVQQHKVFYTIVGWGIRGLF